MGKKRIGIIYGGKSAEHEVSIQSAKNIEAALDPALYEAVMIFVEQDGTWPVSNIELAAQIDIAFPIIHGPGGEDGSLQGMLQLAGIPYVGAGVTGSAAGMDKDVMKRLLRDADLPIGRFHTLRAGDFIPSYEQMSILLGQLMFIKPANLGSSIGVSKVSNADEYAAAIEEAFKYDHKILVEELIRGREIESAVLGGSSGGQPRVAQTLGEIKPRNGFYSYEAKYLDADGADLSIPPSPEFSDDLAERVRDVALKTFVTLNCEGLARVDMFVTVEGDVLVNEINTLPGFTNISMYPKLWEASGMKYTELITELIELAVERFKREQELKTSRG